MSADHFPGFASHWIDTDAGRIFARSHGAGAPLLLLHGFGETHVAWRSVAPALAQNFFVVAMDLRGYGWSVVPDSEKGEAYAKRAMAADAVKVMEEFGHAQFALAGIDRGARVGMRLALDHPGRLSKLAVINIAPEGDQFGAADLQRVGRATLLSSDAPKPETLIGLDAKGFLEDALTCSSKDKSLDPFAPALDAYRQAFDDPARIHAFCEDFRAGAGPDKAALEADKAAGKKILTPTLAVWGEAAFAGEGPALEAAWRNWAQDLRVATLDCGLWALDEAPASTGAALEAFFLS